MATNRSLGKPMTNRMKRRLNVFVSLMLLVFVVYILANLFSLSVVHAEEYQTRAANQQMKSIQINANRGTIYDANMEIMANSATVWTLVAAPNIMEQVKEEDTVKLKKKAAADIAAILEIDAVEIEKKFEKDSMYEYIKKKIEKPQADALRVLIEGTDEIDGYNFLTLIEDTKRYYPLGTSAGQVLGFTSDSGGAYGIEGYYNDVLQGTPGKILTAVDGKQNPIPTSYEKAYDPVQGNSLVLTIDSSVQHYAEQAIADAVNTHKPLGGASAVVMDVKTGAILAMASNPIADPNVNTTIQSEILLGKLAKPQKYEFTPGAGGALGRGKYVDDEAKINDLAKYESELVYEQWKNLNTTMQYQPGSVFKIITGAAALEDGTITYDGFKYTCQGHITIAGTKYGCHKLSGHGSLNFKQSIVNSCNPAFIEIGQQLGIQKFNQFLDGFGISEKTGIDLDGEVGSDIVNPETMTVVDLASESFGQTLGITPLQMITAAAAIANGGYLVQPYVVAEILDTDGSVLQKTQTNIKRQVISQNVSTQMMDAMEAMVSAGGGSPAYIEGYRVAGKSGTAQIGNQRGSNRYIGTFLAVAPANDPQIAVLVVVNEPTSGQYYGSQVAGPALGSILKNTLPYLNISPEFSEEDLEKSEPAVPNLLRKTVKEAKELLKEKGLDPVAIGDAGDEEIIVDQMPKSGVSTAKGSKVLMYTIAGVVAEQVDVPTIVGDTPSVAKEKLRSVGLNYSISGSSMEGAENVSISTQSVAANTKVDKGTVVVIACSRVIVDG